VIGEQGPAQIAQDTRVSAHALYFWPALRAGSGQLLDPVSCRRSSTEAPSGPAWRTPVCIPGDVGSNLLLSWQQPRAADQRDRRTSGRDGCREGGQGRRARRGRRDGQGGKKGGLGGFWPETAVTWSLSRVVFYSIYPFWMPARHSIAPPGRRAPANLARGPSQQPMIPPSLSAARRPASEAKDGRASQAACEENSNPPEPSRTCVPASGADGRTVEEAGAKDATP